MRFGVAILAGLAVVLSLLPSLSEDFRRRPIDARPNELVETMADWINALPGEGRVDVETFGVFGDQPWPFARQDAFASLLLSGRTRRLMLGGHYAGYFEKANTVNFISGSMMGRSMREWTDGELTEHFQRYNVRYLLTWSEAAAKRLSWAAAVVDPVDAPAGFRAWRVKNNGSYFLAGQGRLAASGYDRLEFADVVAGADGRAVVSFHWAPTLICQGATLESTLMPGDPVPFIVLARPESTVRITNGGAW